VDELAAVRKAHPDVADVIDRFLESPDPPRRQNWTRRNDGIRGADPNPAIVGGRARTTSRWIAEG
jgi:hypothetical protein